MLPKALVPVALSCLCLPAAAGAAQPANGPIVFERGSGLFSAPSKALSTTGYDHHPAVSPDGNRIAYTVNRDLWVMDADGTGKTALTTDGAFNDDPSWSPDGTRLVFTKGVGDGRTDLFVMKATPGAKATNLTRTGDNSERNADWSPDGRRIAYERVGCATPRGGGACVYVMGTDGSGQRNLTPEDVVPGCEDGPGYFFDGASKEPAWSPDGEQIAFAGPTHCDVTGTGSDIWVMSAFGAGKVNLNLDAQTSDQMPTYSPDGSRIAFVSNRPSGTQSIFTMGAGGGGIAQVTTGRDDSHPDWGPKAHCLVPKLKGRTVAQARKALETAGCKLGKVTGKGKVRAQAKPAGKHLALGGKVGVRAA